MKIHPIFFILIVILCLALYILCSTDKFIIKDKFDNTNIINLDNDASTSYSISSQIANLLGISNRRISNLAYGKQIINGELNVFFKILDYNFLEKHTGEIDATTAEDNLKKLLAIHQLIVNINNKTILLNLVNDSSGLNKTNTDNLEYSIDSKYFNNDKLLDITNYIHQVYDTVPKDESMTNFFTLGIDKDNLEVKIIPPSNN